MPDRLNSLYVFSHVDSNDCAHGRAWFTWESSRFEAANLREWRGEREPRETRGKRKGSSGNSSKSCTRVVAKSTNYKRGKDASSFLPLGELQSEASPY